MPQEIYIIGKNDEPLNLSEWERAVEETEGVRLEGSLEDSESTFEDADFFDPTENRWIPAFRWGEWGIAFNARAVGSFNKEYDPLWKVVCKLAMKLDAVVRHDDGETFDPETGKAVIETSSPYEDVKSVQIDIGSSQQIEIIFPNGEINCVHLSEALVDYLKELGITKNLKIAHRKVALNKIPERVENSKYGSFNVENDRFSFSYRRVTSFDHDVIRIKSTGSETVAFWESILERFGNENSFIQAYLIDHEYLRWQTFNDPKIFEAHGKPHEHLKKIKKNAPPPLDQLIIDPTEQPGRRIFTKKSYVEAIGGIMWLSESFFELTRAKRAELSNVENIILEEGGKVLKVIADTNLFKNGDEDQDLVNRQNRLRSILFPKEFGEGSYG